MSDTDSNSLPPFLVSEEDEQGGYKYRDFGNLTEEEVENSSSRPPSPASTTPSRNGNNTNGNLGSSIRVQRFPVKLYAILAQPEFKEIITWMPHGRSWKVLKPNLFESLVMPLFFEYRNYHSFNRLINAWSFRRISSGPDRGSYYHELFLRGMPHLHKHMRRLPKTHKKLNMNKQDEPDFYKLDTKNPLPRLKENEKSFLNSSSSPTNSPMMMPTSMANSQQQQQQQQGNSQQQQGFKNHSTMLQNSNINMNSTVGGYSYNSGIPTTFNVLSSSGINDCKFDTSRDGLYGNMGQGFLQQQSMNGCFDNYNNNMGMNMDRMSAMNGMNHVTSMNGIQNLRGSSNMSDFDTPFGMVGSSPMSSAAASGMLDTYQLQKQQQKHLRQLQQMQMLERQMGATTATSAFEPAWFQ